MVEKVILKFNAAVGMDPLPKIREITAELKLRVDEVVDDKPASGRKLRLVTISGEPKGLFELAKRLRRIPAVTVKIA
jgi:hypothetical protein